MTASTLRPRPGADPQPPQMALPTRQFRPGFAALGVLLIVGLAVSGAWLYQRAGAKTSVVQVVREVPAGQVVTRDDLSSVAVAGDLTAIAAQNLDSVVGQSAAVTLVPGVLLQRAMLSDTQVGLQAGQAQVGVSLTGAQIPGDLAVGDTVQVFRLTETGKAGSSSEATLLVSAASVVGASADPASTGGTLVTLTVPESAAGDVAAASGAGEAAVVRVAAS